jgi:hypothetical protein
MSDTFLLIGLFFVLNTETVCSIEVSVKPYKTTMIQIIEGNIFRNQNLKSKKKKLILVFIFSYN